MTHTHQRAAAAMLRVGNRARGAGWTPDGTYGGFVGTVTYAASPVFVVTTDDGQTWQVNISPPAWHPGGYRQWISADAVDQHTCEYTADGLDDRHPCGKPATVKNPHGLTGSAETWFDYDEWYCAKHANPEWIRG